MTFDVEEVEVPDHRRSRDVHLEAADSSDGVHVTYYDLTNGYLLYAVGE